MDDLYFDPVKVDTSLAEEYIAKKNIHVDEPKQGRAWDYEDKTLDDIQFMKSSSLSSVTGLNRKLRNLSKKLQDNSELFCQLEHLMRKTDIDVARNCCLIISQYLRHDERNLNIINNYMSLVFVDEGAPLYCLGHVATMLRCKTKPKLVCVMNTAPVCHLFYTLCLDVGLEISLHLINSRDRNHLPQSHLPKLTINMGCTLTITEDADIDSAVDVFINSSEQAPWRIERIYVQENVYEQLMEALEARCTRVANERCVDAFRTSGGRGVECGAGAGGGGVPVRAYRGARDLLSLLPAEGSLSLWCGSAAAAHEIALASPSDLIWIDHYAVFDGPPSASIPLYYDSLRHEHVQHHMPENVYTRLLEVHRTWIALALDERKTIVLEVLEKALTDGVDDAPSIAKLAEDIAAWVPADLIDIAPDRMTMVIERPALSGTTTRPVVIMKSSDKEMLEILKLTILGYICILQCMFQIDNNRQCLPSKLFEAGVPLTKTNITFGKTLEIKIKLLFRKKKVIHSRFGTIYAN